MKLSQSVGYALQAALQLAETRNGPPVSCAQLAAQGKMPERFLLQILRNLTKQGILHSTRGGGGGFMLTRRPEEISVLEVIEAVDGPLAFGLPMKSGFPPEARERLNQSLRKIADETRRRLSEIRLAHLLADPATAATHEN